MASIIKTLNRGVELLQHGKWEPAAGLFREALGRTPGNPDALHLLAVAVFQLGDAKAAAEYATRATKGNPSSADFHSNLGRYRLALGQLEEGKASLEQALRLCPTHAMAHMNLALTLLAMGRGDDASRHMREYVRLQPQETLGYMNLGNLLAEQRRHKEAMECFQQALAINPSLAEAENNMASSLHALGRLREALEHYETALRLSPNYPEAWSNKGATLQAMGQRDQALACYEEALRLKPGMIQARGNIGNLLEENGRPEEAMAIYRQILADAPQSAETWNNLGNCLQSLGRYEDAMEAYREALRLQPGYHLVHNNIGNTYQRQSRYAEAVSAYEAALRADANFVEAMNNLGVTLQDMGRLADAAGWFEKALLVRPDYVDPLINLSNNWRDRGFPEKAIGYLRRALAQRPDNGAALNNLGCALGEQGMVAEALECYRGAMKLMPDNNHAHSNLLLNLHYLGDQTPRQVYEAHREFGRRHEPKLAHLIKPHDNDPDPDRPLRVAYVSADFRRHSVAFFLEPILERHNHEQVRFYCYSEVTRTDEYTKRFQALAADRWRQIRGMNHERFIEQVRADRIDILVDLGGHTANSRLMSFAGHPAPVQISYLGYPNTTGMESIDYRLTDAWADPAGQTDSLHSEELIRLAGGFLCFRPPLETPPVAPLPVLSGEAFTFGSFNNMAKVSPATLDLWGEVLRRSPGSRLVVKNKALSGSEARVRLQDQLSARGVAPSRVFMSGLMDSLAEHLDAYKLVDLALDTWPYHGTTTTCEALWMGVPVVSLVGQAHVSRVGLSLLDAVGLNEFAVHSPQDYVERARQMISRPDQLAALRAGLRATMSRSRLVDEVGFTAELERAYRRMWRTWCQRKG